MPALTMTQATAAESSPRVDAAPEPSGGWTTSGPRRGLPPEATTRRARLVSALCFGAVCVAMIVAGLVGAQLGGAFLVVGVLAGFFGVYGIPAALILDWTFGPRAGWAPRSELAGFGFRVGALAVLIGDLTVVGSTVVWSNVGGVRDGSDLGGIAIGAYILGLLIVGLPALVATVPASWAWIAVLRRVVAWQAGGRGSPATTE